MTPYDIEVIEEWREGFTRHRNVFGVQPDIWERIEYLKRRGYRRFPHIQLVMGRRASKGYISAIVAAEQIAYLISLDDPQAYYGIRDGKDMFCQVGATSQTVAQRQLFADIRGVVEQCEWMQPTIAESKDHQMRLRTGADLRRIAKMRANDVPIEHSIASLWVVALSASSVAGRGPTSYCNCLDEFAFHVQGSGSIRDSGEIYDAWEPSLGQLGKDGLTLIPSSPFSKAGRFYELYQHGSVLMSTYHGDSQGITEQAVQELKNLQGDRDEIELTAEPGMLIVQTPSWGLYQDYQRGPELVQVRFTTTPEADLTSEEQERRRLRNPEKFAVERLGQFAEVIDQYLDPFKVDAIFDPVSWRDPSVLEPTPFGKLSYSYRIHVDPSKVAANFALAIAHTEIAPPDEHGNRWPHVIIDRLHVWRPQDFPINPDTGKHEVDYIQIEKELDQILYTFPSTYKFSADQFNSIGLLQKLKKKYSPKIRIVEDTATEKSNYERCEKFKSAINLGWVHSIKDNLYIDGTNSLLALECKFLSENRAGKVVKQEFGPVITRDLFDCVSTVTVDLLHDALERWGAGELTARSFGSTNIAGLKSGREQVRTGSLYVDGNKKSGTKSWDALAELSTARRRGIRPPPGYSPSRLRNTSRDRSRGPL